MPPQAQPPIHTQAQIQAQAETRPPAPKHAETGATAPRPDTPGRPAPPHRASVLDTLGTVATTLLPLFARGLIVRRPRVMALLAALDADRRAARYVRRLRRRYGPGPLLLSIPGRPVTLLLSPPDVRRVLSGSPEPFAVANREKRAALNHFQPNGLIVSDDADRAVRRPVNEAVLDTRHRVHRSATALVTKAREEAQSALRPAAGTGVLDWNGFAPAWWRMVRRVVLGDAARDDEEVTDLVRALRSDANWAFLHPHRTGLRDRLDLRLYEYLERAEPGSLVALLSRHPATPRSAPVGQIPHWLFAFDAGGMVSFTTLALLATHPAQLSRVRAELAGQDLAAPHDFPLLRACLQEAVRLWPTTPAILRESTTDTVWDGRTIPALTPFLILTPFFHRDRQTLPYADRFTPDIWLDGRVEEVGSVVPFSGGPAVCPGQNLVLLLASTVVAELLHGHDFQLRTPVRLGPNAPLPGTLNPFGLRFTVTPRPGCGTPTGEAAGVQTRLDSGNRGA